MRSSRWPISRMRQLTNLCLPRPHQHPGWSNQSLPCRHQMVRRCHHRGRNDTSFAKLSPIRRCLPSRRMVSEQSLQSIMSVHMTLLWRVFHSARQLLTTWRLRVMLAVSQGVQWLPSLHPSLCRKVTYRLSSLLRYLRQFLSQPLRRKELSPSLRLNQSPNLKPR